MIFLVAGNYFCQRPLKLKILKILQVSNLKNMKQRFQIGQKNFGLIIRGYQTLKLKGTLNTGLFFLIIEVVLKTLKSTFNHIFNSLF